MIPSVSTQNIPVPPLGLLDNFRHSEQFTSSLIWLLISISSPYYTDLVFFIMIHSSLTNMQLHTHTLRLQRVFGPTCVMLSAKSPFVKSFREQLHLGYKGISKTVLLWPCTVTEPLAFHSEWVILPQGISTAVGSAINPTAQQFIGIICLLLNRH